MYRTASWGDMGRCAPGPTPSWRGAGGPALRCSAAQRWLPAPSGCTRRSRCAGLSLRTVGGRTTCADDSVLMTLVISSCTSPASKFASTQLKQAILTASSLPVALPRQLNSMSPLDALESLGVDAQASDVLRVDDGLHVPEHHPGPGHKAHGVLLQQLVARTLAVAVDALVSAQVPQDAPGALSAHPVQAPQVRALQRKRNLAPSQDKTSCW